MEDGRAVADARSEILGRIATALGHPGVPSPQVDPAAVAAGVRRGYRTAGGLLAGELPAVFGERVSDYGARVVTATAADLPAVLAEVAGRARVLAAPGLEPSWLRALPGAERDDPPRPPRELTEVDTVITACAVAIAETGTVVLDHRADQGRRALTLVPDHHLCVVRQEQVVASVPEAVRALDPRRVLTWISGPSATSDIELDRVVGVHGPRRLDVVVVTAG